MRTLYFALCVISIGALVLPALGSAPPTEQDAVAVLATTEDIAAAPPPPEPISKAEQLLRKALNIRDSSNPSAKDLKRAVQYLYASAGIEHLSLERPNLKSTSTEKASLGEVARSGKDDDQFLTAANVKLQWRNGSIQHLPAVRELIYVFREGDGVPVNAAIAHRLLLELAGAGDPEAQADVGFYLAQGIEPLAPNSKNQIFRLQHPDVPAALVHYYFAARAGDAIAQMSLAYRYLHGLGVPKSCQTAALYYVPVAEKVLELAKQPDSLPQLRHFRLSHKSVHSYRSRPTVEQEFLHYQWFADYGHADAARAVAHLLSHGVARDHAAAVQYLQRAADGGDADAMAHLGHMYANGLAVKQSNTTAWKWFWRAAERGHASGFFGMGYMHLTGQGAEVDHKQAFSYFKQAVEAGAEWTGLGDALFFLGTLHMKGFGTPQDLTQAAAMYSASAVAGNLLAAYNLAVLHLRGLAGEAKGPAACRAAVTQLKRVAERAWPSLSEANDDFAAGDYDWALLNYLKAAEWGSELGQSNAAWMLVEGYGYDGPHAGEAAVTLFRRAAEQGNSAALVRLGDSYWYGKGVPRDWVRAGRAYAQAARHRIPQALFNLGFMHQHGAGVAQDYHLAKRYYDRAAAGAEDAWLPAALGLMGLRVQMWWEKVEPVLPATWGRIGRRVFVGGYGVLGGGGSGGGELGGSNGTGAVLTGEEGAIAVHRRPPRGPLSGLRRIFSLDIIVSLMDALDASFDSSMVLWVAGLLALVLWRRQNLRARAQRIQQQQQWTPQGGGAPPAVPMPAAAAPAGQAGGPAERQGAGVSAVRQQRELDVREWEAAVLEGVRVAAEREPAQVAEVPAVTATDTQQPRQDGAEEKEIPLEGVEASAADSSGTSEPQREPSG